MHVASRSPFRIPLLVLLTAAAGVLLLSGPWHPAAHAEVHLIGTHPLDDPQLGNQPWAVAACEATSRVYLSCINGPHALLVMDAASGMILGSAALTGPYPKGLDVSGDGSRVYVASSGGSLSIVDAETLEELHVTTINGSPRDVCVHEPGAGPGELYVTDRNGARVLVLDAATGDLLTTIGVGAYPEQVRVNAATGLLYVTNLSDDTVSVIDAAAHQVIATIPVGSYPWGVGIDPGLNLIYVTHRDDDVCTVIDGDTHTIAAVYPVGQTPHGLAVDPENHLVYVANRGSNDLSVLNPDGPLTIWLPLGIMPENVAVARGAGRVYVANLSSDDVTAFNSGTMDDVTTLRLHVQAADLALAAPVGSETGRPGHAHLLVANGAGSSVHRMVPWTGEIAGVYEADHRVTDVAARRSDPLLAAIASERGRLLLYDGDSGELLDEEYVGERPWGLYLCEDSERIYVANYQSENLAVYDIAAGSVIETIDLGGYTLDVVVNEQTDRIYVTTWWGLLWMIDAVTLEILDSVSLSGWCEIDQLALDPVRNLVYVASLNCNGYQVVDGQTLDVVGGGSLPDFPTGVSVNQELERAYICNGANVSVIGPGHTVEQTLSLPGPVQDCVADTYSQRVLVSGSDAADTAVIYELYDGDPAAIPPGGTWGQAPVARLRLGSSNPVMLPTSSASGAAVRFQVDLLEAPPSSAPFATPVTTRGVLSIFDIHGRCLRTITNRPIANRPIANRPLSWDGRDRYDRPVPAGTYFARWSAAGGEGAGPGVRFVILR